MPSEGIHLGWTKRQRTSDTPGESVTCLYPNSEEELRRAS